MVRLLVVCGVTLLLLLGAVPLAVPGVPRLHGVPAPVAVAALGLAGVAFLGGLVLLVRGRHARRRDHEGPAPVAVAGDARKPIPGAARKPTPASTPTSRPSPVSPSAAPPAPGFVTVRMRR